MNLIKYFELLTIHEEVVPWVDSKFSIFEIINRNDQKRDLNVVVFMNLNYKYKMLDCKLYYPCL